MELPSCPSVHVPSLPARLHGWPTVHACIREKECTATRQPNAAPPHRAPAVIGTRAYQQLHSRAARQCRLRSCACGWRGCDGYKARGAIREVAAHLAHRCCACTHGWPLGHLWGMVVRALSVPTPTSTHAAANATTRGRCFCGALASARCACGLGGVAA